ncbi:hypothetical protein [Paenibacillus agricola]|uniref:hypothetical protein n=1 Tax=Paenibacillus agricola TaxID=2716264 RepID=UPI001A9D336A|nr:hypothetical protein [Paenibacillus agricola]
MNLWLTLHLVGVVLSVGNIITAAFWKIRADMTKNPAVIHRAAQTLCSPIMIYDTGSRPYYRLGQYHGRQSGNSDVGNQLAYVIADFVSRYRSLYILWL